MILQWAVVAAVVGTVVRVVEERLGLVGRILGGLIDGGWSIASVFVLPVLIVEGVRPREALGRSTQIVRARWGSAVGSYVAVSLPVLPVLLAGLLLAVLLAAAHLLVLGVIVGVIAVVAFLVIGSALSGIARAALYQFATTGTSPLLDPATAGLGFSARRGRSRGGFI